MDATILAAAAALLLFLLSTSYLLLTRVTQTPKTSRRLPPGSLGIPYIGQSLGLLRAMRLNTSEQWLQRRMKKYGPVSKLTLFGKPTVFLGGQATNKFVFANDSNALALQRPKSICRLIGERNLMELVCEDYRRVRGAVGQFLRPEMLRKYVGKMDFEVQQHLEKYWNGRQQVKVLPLMKRLTFDIICSLLFGLY